MPTILPTAQFEALVRDHHAEVYRTARRIVANDADALDVAQQVFLRVLVGKVELATARDRSRLLRWHAARTALTLLRGNLTRVDKEQQHDMELKQRSPEESATDREAHGQLRRHLARLPDELRGALVLRFQEGWTFAQIASELACSEPSAHDRVRRGLERLRGELSRAGFAALAMELPRELALESAEHAAPLPAGLERRLLELRAPAALAASTKLAAGILALSVVVAGAAAAVWLPDDAAVSAKNLARIQAPLPTSPEQPAQPVGESRSVAASAESPGAVLSASAGGTAAAARATQLGTLRGRFLDENHLPVSAVNVLATSLQFDGKKFARFHENALSGSDGRFELVVPVSIETGQEYALATRHPDFVPHHRERELVRVDQSTELDDIALLRSSRDAWGETILDISVLDDTGRAVAHAQVSALRSVLNSSGTLVEEVEHSARTDDSGRAQLKLQRLGNKLLTVQPFAGEWGPLRENLGIDTPGNLMRTLTLRRGLTITGTIVGIGGVVHDGKGGFLAAWNDPKKPWISANIDYRSGAFTLRGLEAERYTLVHSSPGWSSTEFKDVPAGTSGMLIQIKREDDLRDVGDHLAELHGEVRDARTGAVLEIGAFDVSVVPLDDPEAADWFNDLLPTLIFPRPVQTMMFGDYVPPPAFHLDGLGAGSYAIRVSMPDFGPALAGPFALGARELRTGIVIEVQAPASLSGVLLDPDGRPLANGFARITGVGPRSAERDAIADAELRATRGRGARNVWDDVSTDAQGRFAFPVLPAGAHVRVAVYHPDYAMAYSPSQELRAGETLDIGAVSIGARLK